MDNHHLDSSHDMAQNPQSPRYLDGDSRILDGVNLILDGDDFTFIPYDEDDDNHDDDTTSQDNDQALLEEVKQKLLANYDIFNDYVFENCVAIDEVSKRHPEIIVPVVERLTQGIEKDCAPCATTLGALYYDGLIVEQSYSQAAHYYEIGAQMGEVQSVINLGYIYEYGRLGQRDVLRAFTYYATALALSGGEHFEALYKMGDLYNRGGGVPQDKKMAVRLWIKSYQAALDSEEGAPAALRLAPFFLKQPSTDEKDLYGSPAISFDPLKALQFYQAAEVGFRIAIKKGMTYYQRQLEEALKGQEMARMVLDEELFGDDLDC